MLSAVAIRWAGPPSKNSMNVSLAICSENRVYRVQEMRSSGSSSARAEIASGMAKVGSVLMNRVASWSADMAWFCSGQPPPLPHIGQSVGQG